MSCLFSTKDTILKPYDSRSWRYIPANLRRGVRGRVRPARLHLRAPPDRRHRGVSAQVDGGYIWTCESYDGECSPISSRKASLTRPHGQRAVTPDGETVEAEAAHGAVTRHYHQHQEGRGTPPTPPPRLRLTRGSRIAPSSHNPPLAKFAATLEKVCVDTVEAGYMTKDLALLIGPDQKWLSTTGFLGGSPRAFRSRSTHCMAAPRCSPKRSRRRPTTNSRSKCSRPERSYRPFPPPMPFRTARSSMCADRIALLLHRQGS